MIGKLVGLPKCRIRAPPWDSTCAYLGLPTGPHGAGWAMYFWNSFCIFILTKPGVCEPLCDVSLHLPSTRLLCISGQCFALVGTDRSHRISNAAAFFSRRANAVTPMFPIHRSYELQCSFKRRYKLPFYFHQWVSHGKKRSWHNRLQTPHVCFLS